MLNVVVVASHDAHCTRKICERQAKDFFGFGPLELCLLRLFVEERGAWLSDISCL